MKLAADRLVGTWRVVRLAGEPVTGVELAFAMAGTPEAMAVEARLLALLAEPLDVDADGTGLSLGLEPVPVADAS